MMDIVVPTIRDLHFLEHWKPFVLNFHFIFVQDGDPNIQHAIPSWVNYELYNRRDIEAALGSRAWIISQKDASIRNFGFLMSRKPLVWSLDDDCLPATGPDGQKVNAPMKHALNLLTPSTPYMFNTVYDPYRPGADFVRGYPFSLRRGVRTAVSHGLWMNAYDYDAPTQLLKVHERNTRYVDATVTIPHGTLYPLCSMNVAFHRGLIGPAFMQGLMGVGQPWARYDDMFAGWASKVVSDHLGYGCKSGAPYVRHDKASNPFVNLDKEYKGLEWQEVAIRFFDSVQLDRAKDVHGLYLELADKVASNLGYLSPYFARLADAMRIWSALFKERDAGTLKATPSRSSGTVTPVAPPAVEATAAVPHTYEYPTVATGGPSLSSHCALLTYVHNEDFMLPVFLRYYTKHFREEDIYILDHLTTDGSTQGLGAVNVIPLTMRAYFPHIYLADRVGNYTAALLQKGFKCVLVAEVDDIIAPNPAAHPTGLADYLRAFINHTDPARRVHGMHVGHLPEVEPPLDWTGQLFKQRHWTYGDNAYDKALLTKVPLHYGIGLHSLKWDSRLGCPPQIKKDPNLGLLHLHFIDRRYCYEHVAHNNREKKAMGGMLKQEEAMGWNIQARYDKYKNESTLCGYAEAWYIAEKVGNVTYANQHNKWRNGARSFSYKPDTGKIDVSARVFARTAPFGNNVEMHYLGTWRDVDA